jgi:hypothetical protein
LKLADADTSLADANLLIGIGIGFHCLLNIPGLIIIQRLMDREKI